MQMLMFELLLRICLKCVWLHENLKKSVADDDEKKEKENDRLRVPFFFSPFECLLFENIEIKKIKKSEIHFLSFFFAMREKGKKRNPKETTRENHSKETINKRRKKEEKIPNVAPNSFQLSSWRLHCTTPKRYRCSCHVFVRSTKYFHGCW